MPTPFKAVRLFLVSFFIRLNNICIVDSSAVHLLFFFEWCLQRWQCCGNAVSPLWAHEKVMYLEKSRRLCYRLFFVLVAVSVFPHLLLGLFNALLSVFELGLVFSLKIFFYSVLEFI